MGGTSTDVALIESGRLPITPETQLDIYTVRAPAVDVTSIGSGGGSVAAIGPADRVTVGPRSAGASPGPACYGKGGRNPPSPMPTSCWGESPTTWWVER